METNNEPRAMRVLKVSLDGETYRVRATRSALVIRRMARGSQNHEGDHTIPWVDVVETFLRPTAPVELSIQDAAGIFAELKKRIEELEKKTS